jgi:glycosyltransferase involved in cell wall biosynthesis
VFNGVESGKVLFNPEEEVESCQMLGRVVSYRPMKVLLLGNYVNDGQESMQRFAAFLAQGVTRAGHEVRLLRPPSIVGQLRPSGKGVGKWLGYVDKFGSFPFLLRSAVKKVDVVHICDHANSFYTRHLQFVPHVVTCHDLLAVRSALGEVPQNSTRWTGRKLQRIILKGLTRAQHIACVSDATRGDLLRLGGISEQRVSRVYNSLNYPYSPMGKYEAVGRLRKLSVDSSQSFLLHVGGNQWYKNRLGVLRIFSMLRKLALGHVLKLVMVGQPWTTEMRQFISENGMSDLTLELTGVSNEDLRALYSTATMMLFPSLQEGFGWPIVEAQACGCPVATSNSSPMDEVGGDAAIYIDPENPDSAAAILNQALERVSGMREPSIANAARFRSGMIDGYLSLYDKVLKERTARTTRELNQPTTRPSSCSTSGLQ